MELRFVKGNFEWGKFKLQYCRGAGEPWCDVPCVDAPKEKREMLARKILDKFPDPTILYTEWDKVAASVLDEVRNIVND